MSSELTFFAVFDRYLITRLVQFFTSIDLVKFAQVCQYAQRYVLDYIDRTIVPDIVPFISRCKYQRNDPYPQGVFKYFIQLTSSGVRTHHPSPFIDIPNEKRTMHDLWCLSEQLDRVYVYQSFVNAHKFRPSLYITTPPKGLPDNIVQESGAFGYQHLYHDRKPFRFSCLIREAPIILVFFDLVAPEKGRYDCWLQLYFFTDSRFPYLNVQINESPAVIVDNYDSALIANGKGQAQIKFPTTSSGVCRVKIGSITTTRRFAHVVIQLIGGHFMDQPYRNVALDYISLEPLEPFAKTVERSRKRKIESMS